MKILIPEYEKGFSSYFSITYICPFDILLYVWMMVKNYTNTVEEKENQKIIQIIDFDLLL